jgi:hypothetical protein
MRMVTVLNKTKHGFDVHADGRGSTLIHFAPGLNRVSEEDLHEVMDEQHKNPVVSAWFKSGELEIVDDRQAEAGGEPDTSGETKSTDPDPIV